MAQIQERDKVLAQVAAEYERRAESALEYARRYGHLQSVSIPQFEAVATAYREAAMFAHELRENGQAKPAQRRRGRPPGKAKTRQPKAVETPAKAGLPSSPPPLGQPLGAREGAPS
jgi:hypothetical protein